jgi:ubiquinone/menaquinone biosynthesis C-methylase UbiE
MVRKRGKMKIFDLNKDAWDHVVDEGENPYTIAVSPEEIAKTKQGKWSVYLSDCKPVPNAWFPGLNGLKVLCLASGGGQQAPIFAGFGADVTLLDASPKQLAQDQYVAKRENLNIRIVEGDMADLSAFEDRSFELIFNPPSTMFVPELAPIWHECYRVLSAGGLLMTGFINPDEFIFDDVAIDEKGVLEVKHSLPYVEYETLNKEVLEQHIRNKEMFHFSHTMETQLGGLMKAGFVITDFYEDRRPEEDGNPIRHYMPSYYVARAKKVRFIKL